MPIQRNSHSEHAKQQGVPPLSCQAIGSPVLIMPTHRKSCPNHAYLQELIPVPSHVNPYNPAPTHFNGTPSPAPFLEVRPRPLTCRQEAPPLPAPAPWGRCPCGSWAQLAPGHGRAPAGSGRRRGHGCHPPSCWPCHLCQRNREDHGEKGGAKAADP